MNVTQEFLSLNLNSNLNSDSTQLLELLLQKKNFCGILPYLFLAVVTEDLMVSPNPLFVSELQSHPMEMCTECFGSRGECAVIADMSLFPNRRETVITQMVSSACFSHGLSDTGRSHQAVTPWMNHCLHKRWICGVHRSTH